MRFRRSAPASFAGALRFAAAVAACAAGCAGACGPRLRDGAVPPADAGGGGTDAAPGADGSIVADAGSPGPAAFTVVTWNLEQFPLTSSTLDAVVELIQEVDADLYGIEEIADVAAFGELLARLPDHDGIYALEGDGFLRVGMIWKTARVQVDQVQLLFTNDSWAFPRPPLKSRIMASGPGGGIFDFVFIVVHLKAYSDDESRMRRAAAVVALEAYLGNALADGLEDDYVVVGDWNDELTDPPADNVFLPLLDAPEQYIFLDYPLEAMGGSGTYIPFASYLDHILVTAGALDEYGPAGAPGIVLLDAVYPGYVSLVSDHRPVRAVFSAPF